MFGDPWERAQAVEPLVPAGLVQPELSLPFEPESLWSFTSGPHPAWEVEGALAALDFAPASEQTGCVPSEAWVVAAAAGTVVRTGPGFLIQDLDKTATTNQGPSQNDGLEQTGWAILYMHLDSHNSAPLGVHLQGGDPLGHPSCEGGPATGTHLHIARKYNGEWLSAGGALPFVLSGWTAQAGARTYQGTLIKGEQVVMALPVGSAPTWITRAEERPGDDLPVTSPGDSNKNEP
jgi:murein DD-endopeptidase MepM/ murein hydrolase activator NlpD